MVVADVVIQLYQKLVTLHFIVIPLVRSSFVIEVILKEGTKVIQIAF